jgi:DNA-directed RNA polymerase subunit RPC12/RpoP
MVLVALKCPNCGGTVQMEENMKSGFCVHCGSKIVNEPNIGSSVSIDKSLDIVNHLKVAKETLIEQNWETATRLVENILLMDPDCKDAWHMKALLCYRDKAQYENTLTRMKDKELKDYNIFLEGDIKKTWGEYDLWVSYTDTFPCKARTSIDGRGVFLIDKNGSTVFGVNPGRHEFLTQMCGQADGPVFKLPFIAESNNQRIDIKRNKWNGKLEITILPAYSDGANPNKKGDRLGTIQYNQIMDEIVYQTPEVSWEQNSLVDWRASTPKGFIYVTIEKQIKVKFGRSVLGETRYFSNVTEAIEYIRNIMAVSNRQTS